MARNAAGGTSSSTRFVIGGGNSSGGDSDVMDYVTTATTGNAADFGNLSAEKEQLSGCSNGHGGL